MLQITCLSDGQYIWHGKEVADVTKGCVVMKDVFSTQYFQNSQIDKQKKQEMKKRWGILEKGAARIFGYGRVAKPMFMLKHELNIFQLWKDDPTNGPVARLFKG